MERRILSALSPKGTEESIYVLADTVEALYPRHHRPAASTVGRSTGILAREKLVTREAYYSGRRKKVRVSLTIKGRAAIFVLKLLTPRALEEWLRQMSEREDWSMILDESSQLAEQCKVKNYEQYLDRCAFPTRGDRPNFGSLIRRAHKEFNILATSSRFKVLEYKAAIREPIENKKIKVTVLLLNPEDRKGEVRPNLAGSDVIEESRKALCRERENLQPQNQSNFRIRTYRKEVDYSLILVDPEDDGIIQVELHLDVDEERRPAFLVRKDRDIEDFDFYYKKYRDILNRTVDACRGVRDRALLQAPQALLP